MEDIAAGVNNFDELIPALRKIFDCMRESGLKLSSNKWNLERQKLTTWVVQLLRKQLRSQVRKLTNIGQLRMPNTVKRLIGFVQFFRDFIPNLGQNFCHFTNFYAKKTRLQ